MAKVVFSLLVGLLLCATSVIAAFQLDYPYSRYFDESSQGQSPCGGSDSVNDTRTPWFFMSGAVQINSPDESATMQVFIAYSDDATLNDFQSNQLTPTYPIGNGESCFRVDAAQGGKYKAGDTATVMVEYVTESGGSLYQCSDVVFTQDPSKGVNVKCASHLPNVPADHVPLHHISGDGRAHELSKNDTINQANIKPVYAMMNRGATSHLDLLAITLCMLALTATLFTLL